MKKPEKKYPKIIDSLSERHVQRCVGRNEAIDEYEAYYKWEIGFYKEEVARLQKLRNALPSKKEIWNLVMDGFIKLLHHCNSDKETKPYGIPNEISEKTTNDISNRIKGI